MDFVLAFNQQVKHLLSVNCRFTEICHQPDECGVPLVSDLSESGASTGHKYLSDSVLKLLEAFLINLDKSLCGYFLGVLILKSPGAVFLREFFLNGSDFGQNANFKAVHVEQQIGVVLGVNRDKAAFPLDGGQRAGQAVLNLPEDGSA